MTVSDAESVQKTVKKVVEDFGRIDVFVANAGMAISKPILEQTLPEFEKQMSVNGTPTPSVIPLSSHLILPSQRRGLLLQICRRDLQATR
jgi:NAD(P)-dependent dehydrogenase (short-subunit alcohol dehydrogenase family)